MGSGNTRRHMALAGVLGVALLTSLAGRLPGADAASGCRGGNPLANVWSPGRLKLLSKCETVEIHPVWSIR